MKPLQKVVTAPDVESCLYYVHLDSANDMKLLESSYTDLNHHTPNHVAEQSIQGVGPELIKRKPLSVNLPAAIPPNPQQTGLKGPRPMQPRLHPPGLPTAERSVDTGHGEQSVPNQRWSEQQTLKAPELPPRPLRVRDPKLGDPDSFMSAASPGKFQVRRKSRISLRVGTGVTTDESIPPTISPLRPETGYCTSARNESHMNAKIDEIRPSSDNGSTASANSDFSLTLIRRYDGVQSNVGKIEQYNEDDCGHKRSSTNKHRTILKPPSCTTSITILSPGYSKFDTENDRLWNGQADSPDARGRSPVESQRSQGVAARDFTRPFQRQLQPLQTWKKPHPNDRLESNISYLDSPTLRPSFDHEEPNARISEESRNNRLSPTAPPSPTSSDTRGFAFESPWHGLCKFSTGIAGRSLKCKHTLGSSSDSVSELRFNLPSSKTLAPSSRSQSSSDTTRESKRSSIFSHHGRTQSASEYPSPQNHEDKIELDDRMDLSLGQEHAGGGFGGKQAKLGKLIIENEGLKMLDLVVSANIALWWKVYEKTT